MTINNIKNVSVHEPRKLFWVVLTVLVLGCGSDEGTPLEPGIPKDPDPHSQWSMAAPIPEPLQEFHAAVLYEQIYIAGGIAGGNSDSKRGYRYDPESDTWERIADLPAPRHHMPLAVVNDTLYAIGGLLTSTTSFVATDNLWLYNVEKNVWLNRAPMPQPRGASAVGVVDGKIVVVGGYGQGNDLVDSIAIYDPSTDSWSKGASIPTPREHLTAATVNGIVYAIGGRSLTLDSVTDATEAYDIKKDEWTTKSPMPTARGGLGGTAFEDKIYTYGGEKSGLTDRNHEVYDPGTNTWEVLPSMPQSRHGIGVAATDGKVFVIGGGPQAGFSQSTAVQVFIPE